MEKIISKDNKLIKHFTKLCSDKRYRKKEKCFAIEGLRICREALDNNVEINSLIVSQTFFEKNSELIERFEAAAKASFLISDELALKISDTKTPQGIFCVCSSFDNDKFFDNINDGLVLVLDNLQDPSNVGTIIRTADAMGVCGIISSSDGVDLYNPRLLRGTMGGMFKVPVRTSEDLISDINLLHDSGFYSYCTMLEDRATRLSKATLCKKSILVVGNEGNGISQEIADICKESLVIDMIEGCESLNVSVATAILMWEFKKIAANR